MGQGQFQALLVGAASKAGLLLVQGSLQFKQPGHIGALQTFAAQAKFGVQGRTKR
ncbi:hypothetical protein DEDE109153_18195 [Deinococcus deserti]